MDLNTILDKTVTTDEISSLKNLIKFPRAITATSGNESITS
jgi:hypothetical protein